MKPDGGCAFPTIRRAHHWQDGNAPGMSLRDYFAAAALQGIIAHGSDAPIRDMADRTRAGGFEAAAAYAWADAMLEERVKP